MEMQPGRTAGGTHAANLFTTCDSRADGFRNLERAGFEWLIGQAALLIGMRN